MKAKTGTGIREGMPPRPTPAGDGPPPRGRQMKGERVSGAAPRARQLFLKEDPGLVDLDAREEEFRKVCLPTRVSKPLKGCSSGG